MMHGHFAVELLLAPASFVTRRKHRAFGRVANHFPYAFFLQEMGIVAADQNVCVFEQQRAVALHEGFALKAHFALGLVAFTGYIVTLACHVKCAHGHLADGERSGFVGANYSRGPEGLHGRQFTDQGAPARHAQHPSPSATVITAGNPSGTAATAGSSAPACVAKEIKCESTRAVRGSTRIVAFTPRWCAFSRRSSSSDFLRYGTSLAEPSPLTPPSSPRTSGI